MTVKKWWGSKVRKTTILIHYWQVFLNFSGNVLVDKWQTSCSATMYLYHYVLATNATNTIHYLNIFMYVTGCLNFTHVAFWGRRETRQYKYGAQATPPKFWKLDLLRVHSKVGSAHKNELCMQTCGFMVYVYYHCFFKRNKVDFTWYDYDIYSSPSPPQAKAIFHHALFWLTCWTSAENDRYVYFCVKLCARFQFSSLLQCVHGVPSTCNYMDKLMSVSITVKNGIVTCNDHALQCRERLL